IGICVGAAALIAAVTWRFKQPLIIAYLLTGVIIGPRIGLRFITNEDSIQTVAEIGLILLLFVIGLEIDLRKMASGGAAVLLTGELQVLTCTAPVLVSALGCRFFLAGAASLVGFSREMGALIAGVGLSTFPYNVDVVAKAVSLRDFFVTLFFVALGMQITIPSPEVLGLALAASAFVIVSRVVVVPILYALRLGLRTSIVPAINLAQVSEFSI